MNNDETMRMDALIAHLEAALVLADDLSQTLIAALIADCIHHARDAQGDR